MHRNRSAYRREAKPSAHSFVDRCRSDGTPKPRLVSAVRTGTGRYFIDAAHIPETRQDSGFSAQPPVIALTSLRFVVVGAGRLGSSLALALRTAGAQLEGFTARTPEGRARAESWLGGRAAAHLKELASCSPHLYIVAVPDDALPGVAHELGGELRRGTAPSVPVVAHTSGAISVAILSPCEQAGAATLAFHPLQTFIDPIGAWTRFAGAAIAITPSVMEEGSAALAFGLALAGGLRARPFLLADDKRILYHAAATFACNYLVTLESHAEQLFVKAGLPREEALSLFLPLVKTTLDNIAVEGTVDALTGPLSRGDIGTVAGHVRALEVDAPHLIPLYRLLGLATLDLIRARSEISPETIAELAGLLTASNQSPELESDRQGT